MLIDEAFRLLLQSLAGSGTAVEKGKISEEQPTSPRVQFQRASTNQDVTLNGSLDTIATTIFDVEVGATDEATAATLADGIKNGANSIAGINGYRGLIATTNFFIHGGFAEDHLDDYEPKLLDADEGYFVASFQAEIYAELLGS